MADDLAKFPSLICPFMSANGDVAPSLCMREQCALWVAGDAATTYRGTMDQILRVRNGQCAILKIAVALPK